MHSACVLSNIPSWHQVSYTKTGEWISHSPVFFRRSVDRRCSKRSRAYLLSFAAAATAPRVPFTDIGSPTNASPVTLSLKVNVTLPDGKRYRV